MIIICSIIISRTTLVVYIVHSDIHPLLYLLMKTACQFLLIYCSVNNNNVLVQLIVTLTVNSHHSVHKPRNRLNKITHVFVADGRKCIISILSYPDGCQDVGYGDDRGSTMPDI